MQKTAPTPASIDAALAIAASVYAKEGVRIHPAKAFPATDTNGPRIRVRLTQNSWSATVTIEDFDGDGEWYADATIDSTAKWCYSEDDLTDAVDTFAMVRDVLRTVKRAVGQR